MVSRGCGGAAASSAVWSISLTSAPLPKFVIHRSTPLTRTSEAKGHLQVYGSSAAFRFEVPKRACGRRCKNFKSAALERRVGSHASRDVSPLIEARADSDVQTRVVGIPPCRHGEAIGLAGRCRKSKAGRTPRALSHTASAGVIEGLETGADLRAGVSTAALHRREVIAEKLLHLLDGGAEAGEVALDQRRQELHQREPAQLRGRELRHWGQRREGFAFLRAMQALTRGIEHDQDTPVLRERNAADDRRRAAARSMSAVDHQPALLEQAYSDTRARAAPQPDGVATRVERQTMQAADGGGQRERELRA